jgi:hypothetical protein
VWEEARLKERENNENKAGSNIANCCQNQHKRLEKGKVRYVALEPLRKDKRRKEEGKEMLESRGYAPSSI